MDTATSRHYRACNLCEAMCGIEVQLAGRDVVSIRGDEQDAFSGGYICPKALALKDIYEDPDRLRQPVRRAGDEWVTIGWDEALDEVAQRLHDIQTTFGKHAVGIYLGNPNVHNFGTLIFGPPFLRTLGSPNRFSATSCDQLPLMVASYFMFGHQLLFPVPDIDRTDFMLMLGANPLASNGSIMAAPGVRKRLKALRKRGGKLVVVDPRRSETAQVADEHVFIRPGADAYFLLAVLHELFKDGATPGRLEQHIVNADRVEAIAAAFSPERVESLTGVTADTVRRLASELRRAPTAVVYGRMGASTQEFGTLCMWLINAINAVTGNLDEPGGSMFSSPAVDVLNTAGGFGAGRGSFGRWRSRVRGLPEFGGELPSATMAEEMLTEGDGQIRAMITLAGNPVLSTPNGAQLDRAYDALDFSVSIDFYVNETSRHADIILPPVSPIERSHFDLALNLTAVRNVAKYSSIPFDTPHDQYDDWEILAELTSRLIALRDGRLGKRYLKSRAARRAGPERILDLGLRFGPHGKRLNPLGQGLSLKTLKASPHGVDLGPLRPVFPERIFTKQGTIDLAPDLFLKDTERLRARMESPSQGDLLLIGRRHLRSNNSWMHNTHRLMKGRDRCTLMMHPEDAARVGVSAGDIARIRSRVGEVEAPVEVTDDLMRGVVSLPHGFGHGRQGVRLGVATERPGVSINDLTDEHYLDVSGNAAFSGVEVTVTAV